MIAFIQVMTITKDATIHGLIALHRGKFAGQASAYKKTLLIVFGESAARLGAQHERVGS
jgi:hypothetical protein